MIFITKMDSLPIEILLEIYGYLRFHDIQSIRQVSTFYHELVVDYRLIPKSIDFFECIKRTKQLCPKINLMEKLIHRIPARIKSNLPDFYVELDSTDGLDMCRRNGIDFSTSAIVDAKITNQCLALEEIRDFENDPKINSYYHNGFLKVIEHFQKISEGRDYFAGRFYNEMAQITIKRMGLYSKFIESCEECFMNMFKKTAVEKLDEIIHYEIVDELNLWKAYLDLPIFKEYIPPSLSQKIFDGGNLEQITYALSKWKINDAIQLKQTNMGLIDLAFPAINWKKTFSYWIKNDHIPFAIHVAEKYPSIRIHLVMETINLPLSIELVQKWIPRYELKSFIMNILSQLEQVQFCSIVFLKWLIDICIIEPTQIKLDHQNCDLPLDQIQILVDLGIEIKEPPVKYYFQHQKNHDGYLEYHKSFIEKHLTDYIHPYPEMSVHVLKWFSKTFGNKFISMVGCITSIGCHYEDIIELIKANYQFPAIIPIHVDDDLLSKGLYYVKQEIQSFIQALNELGIEYSKEIKNNPYHYFCTFQRLNNWFKKTISS